MVFKDEICSLYNKFVMFVLCLESIIACRVYIKQRVHIALCLFSSESCSFYAFRYTLGCYKISLNTTLQNAEYVSY